MLKKLLLNWMPNIMDKYKVKLLPRAFRDIGSIYAYIASAESE